MSSSKYDWGNIASAFSRGDYSTWTEASRSLGIPRKTLSEAMKRQGISIGSDDTVSESCSVDTEAILASVFERIRPCTEPVPKVHGVLTGNDTSIAFLLGDLHYGAHFRGDDLIPSYNSRIAASSLHEYFDWIERTTMTFKPERIHIVSLGDLVDGTHLRLQHARETDLHLIDQCMDVIDILRYRLVGLVRLGVPVSFWSVPGNHARVQQKVGAGHPAENLDLLIARFLERHLENMPIDFIISPNWYLTSAIAGHRVLAFHGDEVRGYAHPAKRIAERASAYQMNMLRAGDMRPIDSVFCGHFHNQTSNDNGAIKLYINGTFQVSSEFTARELGKIARPSQTAVLFNPQDGAYGQVTCYLRAHSVDDADTQT